ncbi:galectin-3-binding protein A-like [Rhinichthys klamathensis goyatoka]|uniref:galectin-3-binding protein A-like n=1 Tax=Rhinichthys klamathensis goyatoka TaxID=3034132 RepID=UPI0024B4F6B2|nr:galectin-3-binding protein A-like [Rhinichthys klamathensis goyatoka]XP_056117917.1 galectin-3-binding protein A-like [Rhinichthys klamathensis goyatoka]
MRRIMYLLLPLLFLHVSAQRWMPFDHRAKQPTQEGNIRLVGDLPSSGRVEIYHDGQWGTVCDDGWDVAEAQVVCRQMGFPGAISVTSGGQYGEGSGPVWLDDMNCKGSESSLSGCSFKGWGVSDCTHKEDAGVTCDTGKNITSNRQFSVDNSLGLSDDLGLLFDSEDGCDFSINVQDLSEEAELAFCVHRLILMIYPELNITNESRNLTLDVSQTCHPHVSAFLRYLYTRQIDVSITSAQCLHQLSFIFGVKTLMEDVGRVFTSLLPEDNTFQTQVSMYEYGVRTGDLVLQENVLQYLSWNCEFLISSPLWSTITFHMMDALLQRSDLVVEDEALLLEALERWIQDKSDKISSEQQASLLNHIRFLLIPVDKLYEMQFSSSVLYQDHEKLYLTGLLRGFQFNALPFSMIRNKMDDMSNDYLPRIYTAKEWSVLINDTTTYNRYYRNHYNYGQNYRFQSFSTPAHTSALYKEKMVQWQAQVFLTVQDCSNYGVSCDSFPVARFLASGNQNRYANTIRFNNKLILTCKNQNNVFHVQEFKNDMAMIPTNSSMGLSNPCPDDYSFSFVVRPEYI